MNELIWCEVSAGSLAANCRHFRSLLAPGVLLAPTVKANAYGHGLLEAAEAFLAGGAHWLAVNSVEEAAALRAAGVDGPLYVMGYIPLQSLAWAMELRCRMVVYNMQTVDALGALAAAAGPATTARVHIKLETGNYRQGVDLPQALTLAARIADTPGLELEGLSSHFADIEDTTDHTYARQQLERFQAAATALRAAGHPLPVCHCSNSAATLLWPETHFDLVRIGISAYGMWPSAQTRVSAVLEGRHELVHLQPALTWKTRVAQVKQVPEGAFIGYGRSYRTTHTTRLAVLPVGYYDGYDRRLSNLAYVLIHGRRAPVRGRVCMNMIMVDVTHIPGVTPEDEVVLLGRQGEETLSAEQLADWIGTINYEVTTRIADHVPRRVVD